MEERGIPVLVGARGVTFLVGKPWSDRIGVDRDYVLMRYY